MVSTGRSVTAVVSGQDRMSSSPTIESSATAVQQLQTCGVARDVAVATKVGESAKLVKRLMALSYLRMRVERPGGTAFAWCAVGVDRRRSLPCGLLRGWRCSTVSAFWSALAVLRPVVTVAGTLVTRASPSLWTIRGVKCCSRLVPVFTGVSRSWKVSGARSLW